VQVQISFTALAQAPLGHVAGLPPATLDFGIWDGKPGGQAAANVENPAANQATQETPHEMAVVSERDSFKGRGVFGGQRPMALRVSDGFFSEWSMRLPGNSAAVSAEGRPMAIPRLPAYSGIAGPLGGTRGLVEPKAASSGVAADRVTTPSDRSFSESWQAGAGEWSLAAFMVAAALTGPPEMLGDLVKDRVFANLANHRNADAEGESR
jgi:hypothetical protein